MVSLRPPKTTNGWASRKIQCKRTLTLLDRHYTWHFSSRCIFVPVLKGGSTACTVCIIMQVLCPLSSLFRSCCSIHLDSGNSLAPTYCHRCRIRSWCLGQIPSGICQCRGHSLARLWKSGICTNRICGKVSLALLSETKIHNIRSIYF